MSLLLELPAELVYCIGGLMLEKTYHDALFLLLRSCTCMHVKLHDRIVQARLLHAWKKDWRTILKHVTAGQMAIIERYASQESASLLPILVLLDECVIAVNMDVLTHIITTRKFCKNDVGMVGLFFKTCNHGHLAMAQWLTRQFNLTPQDARIFDNCALRMSCSFGQLDVAQWLTQHFGLTAEDARALNNHALRFSLRKWPS